MAVLGIQPALSGGGYTIPTETAATAFGLLAGVAGGLAQIVAGNRLSQVRGDRIKVRDLALPVAIGGLSTVVGALIIPTEGI